MVCSFLWRRRACGAVIQQVMHGVCKERLQTQIMHYMRMLMAIDYASPISDALMLNIRLKCMFLDTT